MMNSVHNLPTNLPMELPTKFIPSVISLVKMTRHHFFSFVLIFFPTVIPSVYTEGIFLSVKSLENLPMEIFPRYFRLYLSIFWQCLLGLAPNSMHAKVRIQQVNMLVYKMQYYLPRYITTRTRVFYFSKTLKTINTAKLLVNSKSKFY